MNGTGKTAKGIGYNLQRRLLRLMGEIKERRQKSGRKEKANALARFAHSSSTSNNSLSFSETEVLADIAIANQLGHSHSISSYLAAVTA